MPSAIDGLDDDDHKSIYDSTFDLTSVFSVKSANELKTMLDEHYYVNDSGSSSESNSAENVVVESPVERVSNTQPVVETKKDDSEDEVLKELLEGLDV